jgi:hypothetical protein
LLAFELARVLVALPGVERARRREAPGPLLARLRARGRAARPRDGASRARLARAIGWVDRRAPGGPRCLRRALLRVALDADAARAPVLFGLDLGEGKGHAWVDGTEERGRFDVEFPV